MDLDLVDHSRATSSHLETGIETIREFLCVRFHC